MLKIVLSVAALFAAPLSAAERRCGWLDNPTPANWWLTDAKGEWKIMTQGNEMPDGMETMPDMTTRGWVRTNGGYGYGCACMTVETDKREMRIIRVLAARPMPLKQCRADRALKKR